jgi:hypothetical protein
VADASPPKPEPKKRAMIGTASYDNWCASVADEPMLGEYECLLYTDAWLTGEVSDGLGPYAFLNLVPFTIEPGRVHGAFVLRSSVRVLFDSPEMDKTDQSRYHGGDAVDEIVALASLRCGIRLRAGGESRRFDVGGDPRGQPVARSVRPEPSLARKGPRWVLPTVTGEHSIMAVQGMSSFPTLRADQAIALVRSARLYQDALWLAESEPNQSWLLLVSAVETAANLWRSEDGSPLDRLTDSRPEFVKYLNSTGVEGLAVKVAEAFKDSVGAGKRFREFLLEYLPKPPDKRPPEWAQIDWSPESLSRGFRKVTNIGRRHFTTGCPFRRQCARLPLSWINPGKFLGKIRMGSARAHWAA